MNVPMIASRADLAKRDIDALEIDMLSRPQVMCEIVHHFSPGIAIREAMIPADTSVISHYHKYAHLNQLLKGRALMVNPDGSITDIVAPARFMCPSGRKVLYFLEDSVWQNLYGTDITDIDALEEFFIEKSDGFLNHEASMMQIESAKREADRIDYRSLPEEIVMVMGNDDCMPFKTDMPTLRVMESPIHGRGLFTTCSIGADEFIAPAICGGVQTPAWRYINHSAAPNARMERTSGNNVMLVANMQIEGCAGGGKGSEITVDYRQAFSFYAAKNMEALWLG